eukprot:9846394-Ditylum_brightwellii.AAC.1
MVIRVYAVPVMRYTFGVVKWNKGELAKLDTKTHNMLTKHGFHHPSSNTHCLYLSWKKGGQGLTGLVDMHWHECAALVDYITQLDDPLTTIVKTTPTPIQHHIMKHLNHHLGAAPELNDAIHPSKLKKMRLHGQFFVQQDEIPQVDADQSTYWMTRVHLRGKTEAVMCAAMEQMLVTNR